MSSASAGAYILQSNQGAQDDLITGARVLLDILNSTPKTQRTIDLVTRTHLFPLEKTYSSSVPIGTQYFKCVNAESGQDLGTTPKFELNQYGEFISDCVVHVRFCAMGTAPTLTGDLTVDAATKSANKLANSIKYRWTDYPGIRLFKSVTFSNANSELHRYTRDDVLHYNNYGVLPTQRNAWDRCVGHSPFVSGSSYHRYEEIMEHKRLAVGPQCPKYYQPPLDLWIPLLLFFTKGQPFPSSKVIQGQRNISIELETVDKMVQAIDITAGAANDTLNATGVQALLPGSTLFSTQNVVQPTIRVEKMDLYMNNIFVPALVLEAYMNTLTYTMIRVDKQQTMRDNLAQRQVKMTGFKYPIEHIAFGFRETRNEGDFEKWWRFNRAISTTFRLISSERDVVNPTDNIIALNYQYFEEEPVVDAITISLQGNKLFDNINPSFFGAYATYPRSGDNSRITTGKDPGAYFLSFSQSPGQYQPNGHMNASMNREFHFEWSTSIASTSNNIEFVASAKCIAFILVDSGRAHLTFTV
jgi:hypothetical protein